MSDGEMEQGWVRITRWPSATPSVFQLKRLARAGMAQGKIPEWAKRLPSGRWIVNPGIFWRWLDEAQAANLTRLDAHAAAQAQAAP